MMKLASAFAMVLVGGAAAPVLAQHPAMPAGMTHEQHLAKFRRCLDFAAAPLAAGTPARLVETIDQLETVANVCALGALAANAG